MTTTQQHDVRGDTSSRQLAALRGNCMGAAVLLIVQFGLGISVNLYVTLPSHKPFFSTVFGSALLAAHVIVAVVLLGASIGALVRAIRARRLIVPTAVGFTAVLTAVIAGAAFTGNQNAGASLAMALATAVAMFSYLAAIFSTGRVDEHRSAMKDRG
jgi:hypothetical protein